jgi:hypothetical protein
MLLDGRLQEARCRVSSSTSPRSTVPTITAPQLLHTDRIDVKSFSIARSKPILGFVTKEETRAPDFSRTINGMVLTKRLVCLPFPSYESLIPSLRRKRGSCFTFL